MKKSKLIIAAKIVIFLFLFLSILGVLNRILMIHDGYDKYIDFHKENEPYDILFFGSSRVLDGIQPVQLYEDFGIRSYNMAQHGESLAVNYWQLKAALEENVPQLVIMDISLFYGGPGDIENDEQARAYLHKQLDHMPLGITKLSAIKEMVPSSLYPEYVLPFILYHSSWDEVNLNSVFRKGDGNLGAEIRTNVMPQERIMWTEEETADAFSPENVHLGEIIDLCREKGVDLLFICMPCNENAVVFKTLNCFEEYFKLNNVRYDNIEKNETFLDYSSDFADTSHLNDKGAAKLTNYIGEYFMTNYSPNAVTEKTRDRWNEKYINSTE